MLKLYQRVTSSYSYKVRLLLSLLDLPYERMEIARHPNGLNVVDQAYLRLNPRGQIPTLDDDGVVLWGSTAILTYIAARYDPTRSWLPVDPGKLAAVMQWLELAQNECRTGLFLARAISRFGYTGDLAPARRDSAVALRMLERRLERSDWLAGEWPTLADIACFPDVHLSDGFEISLADHPAVRAWSQRLVGLPGFLPMPRPASAATTVVD